MPHYDGPEVAPPGLPGMSSSSDRVAALNRIDRAVHDAHLHCSVQDIAAYIEMLRMGLLSPYENQKESRLK